MSKLLLCVLLSVLLCVLGTQIDILTSSTSYVVPPAKLKSAPYADWAHKHWVWLNSKDQNETSIYALIDGYLSRDIPVGAVDLDSLWSTGVNNFEWNKKKFPDPAGLVKHFHDKDVKVILWVTSVVDTDSSNYEYGKEKKFYLNDGKTVKWWHGHGSFLDYTNPEAVAWWHKMMDDCCLSIGIDGWKTDGTDPFVLEFGIIRSHAGIISYRDYADAYYGDFFYYTRKQRGPEALIMSRPVDSYKFIYWGFSPRDVVFSGWVGDQDPTFDGLKTALANMMHSAWKNYVAFGSDVGGYRSGAGQLGRARELFIRWFQVGAFCPLFENGGGKEHRPWIFDEYFGTGTETTDIYRVFTHIHHELIPYLLSAGAVAYETNSSILIPSSPKVIFTPTILDYRLGKDIFVAPVLDNSTLRRDIVFPAGSDWVFWFDETKTFKGGSTAHQFDCPLSQLPVFKRAGSIIPMKVSSSYSGHGDVNSKEYMTLLITHPKLGSEVTEVREFGENVGFEVKYDNTESGMTISISGAHDIQTAKKFILVIRNNRQSLRNLHSIASVADSFKIVNSWTDFSSAKENVAYTKDNSNQEIFIKVHNTAKGVIVNVKLM